MHPPSFTFSLTRSPEVSVRPGLRRLHAQSGRARCQCQFSGPAHTYTRKCRRSICLSIGRLAASWPRVQWLPVDKTAVPSRPRSVLRAAQRYRDRARIAGRLQTDHSPTPWGWAGLRLWDRDRSGPFPPGPAGILAAAVLRTWHPDPICALLSYESIPVAVRQCR